jgi:hypothetical protein
METDFDLPSLATKTAQSTLLVRLALAQILHLGVRLVQGEDLEPSFRCHPEQHGQS